MNLQKSKGSNGQPFYNISIDTRPILKPFELKYVYKLKTSFSVYYLMSRTNKNPVTYCVQSATSIAQEFDLIIDSSSKYVKL
jgi:hypothetical protein